jgi:hypothetical protein
MELRTSPKQLLDALHKGRKHSGERVAHMLPSRKIDGWPRTRVVDWSQATCTTG